MASTVEAMRSRFPEFGGATDFPNSRIEMFLSDAITLYLGNDEIRWAGKYNIAHAYLTAHLMTAGASTELGDANSKAGGIVSKSAGGVSVTRAVTPKSRSDMDDFFITSAYGQRFLTIRNQCFAGVLTT